jgi:hypothetical protein
MKRATGGLSIVLAVAIVVAPFPVAAEGIDGRDPSATAADVAASDAAANLLKVAGLLSTRIAREAASSRGLDTGRLRAGLRTLSDDKLRELAPRAVAANAQSSGGGGSKKTLIIVGVVVLAVVLLVVSIRQTCKKQGVECLN